MRLGPNDVLPAGTLVCIGKKRGYVVKHEIVPAHPCGMITVHTVELVDKYVKLSGNKFRFDAIKPEMWKGNYSAICLP